MSRVTVLMDKEGQQMSPNWTYAKLCTLFHTTSLSLHWRHGFDRRVTGWIWIDGRLALKNCSKQLNVQVETSDKCRSSGVGIGTLGIFVSDMDSGIQSPSATSPKTQNCVVLLTLWKEGMPSRGAWRHLRWACKVQQC